MTDPQLAPPHGYAVEVLVNADTRSAYWRIDPEGDVRETVEEAEDDYAQAREYGYAPHHLRIVALSAVTP